MTYITWGLTPERASRFYQNLKTDPQIGLDTIGNPQIGLVFFFSLQVGLGLGFESYGLGLGYPDFQKKVQNIVSDKMRNI